MHKLIEHRIIITAIQFLVFAFILGMSFLTLAKDHKVERGEFNPTISFENQVDNKLFY